MEDEIKILFYDYLFCYERSIRKLKSNKDNLSLIRKFNTLLEEYNITITGKTIEQITNTQVCDNVVYMTKSKTIALDFLRHLRNCIAHVYIEDIDDKYIIKDFNKHSQTMSGIVDKNFLVNLIKTVKNENKLF
jgi:hypothetical protein